MHGQPTPGTTAFWLAAGFLSGSLMFSYWLGRLGGQDVRKVGDGNPGAANAIKAAGLAIGLAGGLLDFLKGALPVALATWPLSAPEASPWGWFLPLIAMAPVLGHIFSPWLAGRGGKGIAVTFGVWAGLTAWQVPCILGGACAVAKFLLRLPDAWVVASAMAGVTLFVAVRFGAGPLLGTATLNLALLIFTHRRELCAHRSRV
ncbi:MAG: glycerol-3-phosphate acyltransferase [bacterium]|jgi:acyl-phosphate glycerol 3-phosphate acyltransferase|nr:glycerol-3-phosphate acyltransferase [candidate division KSB1 bacterium]MDH7561715.1 glycerol-3-phosphate acyltransferase [bacterium]